MAATVSTAWADETYKIKLNISSVTQNIESINLDAPYTVGDATLISMIRSAYGLTDNVDHTYGITLGTTLTLDGSQVTCNVTSGEIIISKPTPSEPFTNIATVTIPLEITDNGVEVASPTETNVQITLYHEQHTADASWETNATHHWHLCSNTLANCGLSTDYSQYPGYGEHVYGTDPSLASYYTCQTPGCGYVDDSRITHTHNYATTWSHDESKHWHACLNTLGTCNADKTDVDDHSYNDAAVGAAYYTCGVCGYENATRKSEPHTHAYSGWMKDETYHWKQCTTPGPCQVVITEKAFHTYGTTGDARFTCQECDFISSSRQAAAEAIDNGKAMAYSWTHDIPFAFAATNIFNDRQLNATGANNKQQGYTVCLPYELTLPATVEVYTLSASKDDQVGFVKTATNTLAPLTPYLIIPSVSGQLLNAPGATVVKTNQALVEANNVTSSAVSGQTTYTLKGSISYKSGDDAAADAANKYFIMQGENIWAKIEGGDYANTGANESKACVLPLRAYLVTDGTAPARLFSIFDEATGISREIVVDADSTPVIYDLQGRKVSNPQRGGLYIINGKKMIMK